MNPRMLTVPRGRAAAITLLVTFVCLCGPGLPYPAERVEGQEKVEVSLVLLDAVVTDSDGRPIIGLGREDFDLIVDNTRVPIASVELECSGSGGDAAQAVRATRHFIVLFDMSHMMAASRRNAIKSTLRFVDEEMGADDRMMLLGFMKGLHVIARMTDDRRLLHDTLASLIDDTRLIDPSPFEEQVALERLRRERGWRIMEARGRYRASGGVLSFRETYAGGLDFECEGDARQAEVEAARAMRALSSAMPAFGSIPGRKALILFTETLRANPGLPYYEACGIPFLARPSLGLTVSPELDDLALQANLAGVSFYPVHAGGMTPLGSGDGHRSAVDFEVDMALSTGGRNSILMKDTLRPFREAGEDLSCYYVVSYRLSDEIEPGKHEVRLTTTRKGAHVRHRDYFTVRTREQATQSRMVAALSSPGLYRDLSVQLHGYSLARVEGGRRQFLVKASVPMSELTFLPVASNAGTPHRVGFRGALIQGSSLICSFDESFPLTPPPAPVPDDAQAGVEALCEVEPGQYDVVVAARDELAGSLGAAWGRVQVKPPAAHAGSGLLLWASADPGAWVHGEGAVSAASPGGNLFIRRSFALRHEERGVLTFLACPDGSGKRNRPQGPLPAGVRLEGPAMLTLPARLAVPDQRGECRMLSVDIPAGGLERGIYLVRPEAAPPWRAAGQEHRIEIR